MEEEENEHPRPWTRETKGATMANDGGLKRWAVTLIETTETPNRPTWEADMEEDECGDWVDYETASALESQLTEARAEIERLEKRAEVAEANLVDQVRETEAVLAKKIEARKRAEAAEARVAELERKLERQRSRVQEAESTSAGKALRERDEARAKLAAADRLAEACRGIGVGNLNDVVQEIREALAAYEAGEPVDSAREAESDE